MTCYIDGRKVTKQAAMDYTMASGCDEDDILSFWAMAETNEEARDSLANLGVEIVVAS